MSVLKLMPFQEAGVAWLKANHRGLLADEPGLGKTIMAAMALDATRPAVVVCPAFLKLNWVRELEKWRPDLKAQALFGRKSFAAPGPGQVAVTNYAILPESGKACLMSRTQVIADECQALAVATTKQHKLFRSLSDEALAGFGSVHGLSGTPFRSSPLDLWGIAQACGWKLDAFQSFSRFLWLFRGRKMSYGGYVFGRAGQEAVDAMRPFVLRRLKKDVLPELPERTYQDIEIEVSDAKTLKAMNEGLEAIDEFLGEVGEGFDLDTVLDDTIKLATGHVSFERFARGLKALATLKGIHAYELACEHEGTDDPPIVFAANKPPVLAFKDRPGWAVVTGDTPMGERQGIVDEFQAGKLNGLACTIRTAGVGWTLTRAASHVIFATRSVTPSENIQAEDRVVRIGQTRGVVITNLVVDHPFDKRIRSLCLAKTGQAAVLDRIAVTGTSAPGGVSDSLRSLVGLVPAHETQLLEKLLSIQEQAWTDKQRLAAARLMEKHKCST